MLVQTKTNLQNKMDGVPQWAQDRAKSIVPVDETIIGIYTISDQNRRNALRAPFAPMLLPIFWPLLILSSPCLLTSMYVQNSILKSTVYIITDKRLYRSIDPAEGNACFTPGRDSGDVLLQDITGVYIDMPARFMGRKFFPVKQVIVNLPIGHPLATAPASDRSEDGMAIRTFMQMFVDDPQEVINVIRKAKDAVHSQPQQVVIANAVVASTGIPASNTSHDDDRSYDALIKLKELLDAGAITKDEYDEKRKAHINRI